MSGKEYITLIDSTVLYCFFLWEVSVYSVKIEIGGGLPMITKIMDKHLENMAEEILEIKDKKIQKFLRMTQQEGATHEAQIDFMKTILSQVLMFPENEQKEAFYDQMEEFMNVLSMHSDSYLFEVELKDPLIQSTREFRMPGFMMMSDLAYAVMAAFRADGSHMFHLVYKKDVFMLNDEEWDSIPADKVPLGALELRKGNVIQMVYDFGDNWEFTIRYKGKQKVDFAENVPVLLGGVGYNIWEDSYELLRQYVENPQQVYTFYEGREITVAECAEAECVSELKDSQIKDFMDEILELKMSYENLEEPDFVDDISTNYQA